MYSHLDVEAHTAFLFCLRIFLSLIRIDKAFELCVFPLTVVDVDDTDAFSTFPVGSFIIWSELRFRFRLSDAETTEPFNDAFDTIFSLLLGNGCAPIRNSLLCLPRCILVFNFPFVDCRVILGSIKTERVISFLLFQSRVKTVNLR